MRTSNPPPHHPQYEWWLRKAEPGGQQVSHTCGYWGAVHREHKSSYKKSDAGHGVSRPRWRQRKTTSKSRCVKDRLNRGLEKAIAHLENRQKEVEHLLFLEKNCYSHYKKWGKAVAEAQDTERLMLALEQQMTELKQEELKMGE